MKGANWTVGDTLAEELTLGFIDRAVSGYINGRTGTGTFQIPDIQALDLVTDLNAAHTFNTFFRLTDQWESFIPWLFFQTFLKKTVLDIQICCDLLKRSVTASYTGCAPAVMLG